MSLPLSLGKDFTGTKIKRPFLTETCFFVIALSRAARIVHKSCDRSVADPFVLAEALKAVGSDTREPKWLIIDDVPGAELLSSEDWDVVFSPLLSDQSSLEAISVDCSGTMLGAVCTQIGYLLAKSSTLEILWFGTLTRSDSRDLPSSRLSDPVVKTLSEGLVQTKSLIGFGVTSRVLEREFADMLISAFTANVQSISLEWILLPAHVERLGMVLEVLLSTRFRNLKKIQIALGSDLVPGHTVDNFQAVADYFRRWQQSGLDTTKEVRVEFHLSSQYQSARVLCCWDKWVSANESSLMLKTGLKMWDTELKMWDTDREVWEVWINEIPKRFTKLKSLHISLVWRGYESVLDHDMDQLSVLCKGIQSADSVESICIDDDSSRRHKRASRHALLFQCLQHKRRLKELTLVGRWEDHEEEEIFRGLMDLLHLNIYLEEVKLEQGALKGKELLVQEALRRNREQAAYFSTLRDAKFPFEKAKAARVFLCGEGHAGKTSLRITMMKTRQKESRIVRYGRRKLGKLWSGKNSSMKRTKGVDVELLWDDNQMQVSVWDLAGQEIFRALQALLLPAVTQACVFVFVFSPFQEDQSHVKEVKEDVEGSFRLELRSWLRFVASHYPITGTFLPEVLVVITHKDKMKQYGRDLDCEWATPIVNHFRAEYGRALALYATPWYVDAWNVEEVNPFVEKLCALLSKMLSKKTPQAPSICCKLISEILDAKHASSSQMVAKPVWSIQDFCIHISRRLEALNLGSLDQNVENDRRVLLAMIQYMHDVGSIFYLPKCQLVVCDINWFTHKFLGVLIGEGHGFHSTFLYRDFSSENGVVTNGILKIILKELSGRCGKKKVTP
ncbi:hypothetical protein R1sor_021995 [Riccia sorocarpa]|uniref:Uncharacterized protein n=1 Tax=Riccia sorocarpa TaxID=122646 RepID=A0ABD3GPF0_9MARC